MNYVFRYAILLFTGFFFSNPGKGQVVISGILTDENGSPVGNASITISAVQAIAVFEYAVSNQEGFYSITIKRPYDSLQLNVSALNYKRESRIIPAISATCNFRLSPDATVLKEVKLKPSPVWLKHDTLNYQVSEFKQAQDRVIGDIIARLPGISITPGGSILYNGKPINRYYIEGLDLLEDKYGIANGNIPADAVEKVQVLENHQPIRVLDSVQYSDKAAINIKLKPEARMKPVGTAALGIGAAPFLTEDEVSLMNFRRDNQFIVTSKYNNTGKDNKLELTPQNLGDFNTALQNGSLKNDLVTVSRPSTPLLHPRRYLFNNTYTLSVDGLKRLTRDVQCRINLSWIRDKEKSASNLETLFYLPGDTLQITEINKYSTGGNRFTGEITFNANSPGYYINNKTAFKGWWSDERASVHNPLNVYQQAAVPFYTLFNDFSMLKTAGKKILNYDACIGYNSTPQSLIIQPGQYTDLINNNQPYTSLHQQVRLTDYFSDIRFRLMVRKGNAVLTWGSGFNLQVKKLNSALSVLKTGLLTELPDSFCNHVDWNSLKLFQEAGWAYEAGKWRLKISLPLSFLLTRFEDAGKNTASGRNTLTLNPELNISFQPVNAWRFSATFSKNTAFGDISDIAGGYILKTYRNFRKNASVLPEKHTYNSGIGLYYRNPLNLIFCNTSLSFSENISDVLYRYIYTGVLESVYPELMKNKGRQMILSCRTGKYFVKLKTSFSLNYSYQVSSSPQILQGYLVERRNKIHTAGITLDAKVSSSVNSSYNCSYSSFLSGNGQKSTKDNFSIFTQKGKFVYLAGKAMMFILDAEHYRVSRYKSGSADYVFADIAARYRKPGHKIDYEFSLRNIFNTTAFQQIFLFNNMETISRMKIRPFQVLFKAGFRF